MKLLDIKNLKVIFLSDTGLVRAVEGIDIEIFQGESVAIVGESGCGKSVTCLSVMKLLASPPAMVRADKFDFNMGESIINLHTCTENDMLNIRGKEISMIFQDPISSLNPVLTVGCQIDEVFMTHKALNKKQAKKATIEFLKSIGVTAAERRYGQFPHELSGGLNQRILIAIATVCLPKLLIADEPTTALDVTIQAQILELIKDLQIKNNMALLLITHDLGVVANTASRVYVMYCGKIVEHGKVEDIIKSPLHPYTQGLIASVPTLSDSIERFTQIDGTVPHPVHKPSGCSFHPRCKYATDICKKYMPNLKTLKSGRQVRCFLWENEQ